MDIKRDIDSNDSFNFENYKYSLNKMFFSHKEKICLGDKEYHDFWIFLRKYQNIEVIDKLDSRKREIIKEIEKIVNPNWMDIEYLISLKSVNDQDSDSRHGLTKERIIEFREILFLYLHFLKKKRLKALDKLKEEKNNLPIAKFRDTILDLVKNNSVILIAGDTGCGKSTQVPQYLLEAGYTGIACTQPRRIACVSLSKRVSYESQSTSEVGYQIRFDKHKSKDTKLLFLTEGLMLRQITSDPLLSMYNVIILDEVHERHLSCDFLLGLMKCLLIKRDNLKLILMSATINTKLFSWYFGDCPTVEVPGRLYPIELYYYPIRELPKGSKIDSAPYLKMLKMIDDKYPSTQRGDVLIFLSGLNEILNLADALKSYASESKRWVILMLHSSLSLESQDMVFDIPPEGVRKCILSTNIAETSITIDGIRFVIDSGKVKEMNFDKNSRMQRLQEFWISKASAEQRKGRAGRTGPGICYRFYSLKEFDSMEVYSTPEIQRIPLDFLILGMISLGLPDARKFPFLEPPPIECIEESLKLLKNYGALTSDESITSMGKMLSRLPVDLSIGKMLILGSIFQVSGIILTLSAALSVQSPFSLAYRHIDSIEARKEVESNEGDPFVLINAYNRWLDIKFEQKEDSRKWCKKRGFEQERFYEMTKLRRQFKEILKDSGLYWSNEYCASTSSERIRRHGEVSQLRTLKRKIESVGPKKKILKLGLDGEVEDKEDNDYDLKEIEFRLEYNSKQIKKLRQESDSLSRKEILLIKLILSSGLYPQFALPDEFNSVKKDSDQMYHTKKKQFVVLHPNSIYSLNPEILNTSSKNVNAMLTYVSLLETNRPYLCNCLHIPPLHNSLLLCQSIDTNKDFTRIICDQWIEYTFPLNIWQLIIKKVIKIRFLWEQLIEQVFKEYFIEDVVKNNKEMVSIISQDLIDSQRHLVKLINNFFKIDVTYKMRRLMSADIKVLYKKSSSSSSSSSSLSSSSFLIKENLDLKSLDIDECLCYDNNKGGWRLTNYLIYDCLTESDYDKSSYLRKHWTCDICSIVMMCTPSEQYEHRQSCLQVINKDNKKKDKYNSNNNIDRDNSNNDIADYKDDDDDDDEKANEISSNRILRKIYDCNICGKQLDLTTIEILKHIREHN